MKKEKIFLLAMISMSCLIACSCGKNTKNIDEKNIDETLYQKAQKAVEVAQKYLDTDLEVEKAIEKMERLSAQTESFESSTNSDERLIAIEISLLESELENAELGQRENDYSEDAEIQKTVKELKERLD